MSLLMNEETIRRLVERVTNLERVLFLKHGTADADVIIEKTREGKLYRVRRYSWNPDTDFDLKLFVPKDAIYAGMLTRPSHRWAEVRLGEDAKMVPLNEAVFLFLEEVKEE